MTVGTAAMVVWVVFLLAAWPYVGRIRHPKTPMVAAYLLFVSIFSLISAALFFGLTWVMGDTRIGRAAESPIGAGILLALIFVIALLAARAQIRRPPRQRRVPD